MVSAEPLNLIATSEKRGGVSAGQRSFEYAVALACAIFLSSCAHGHRSPTAHDWVEVTAAEGSTFVVLSRHMTPTPYELRKSVKLAITPYGELTADGNGFFPAIVLPVEESIGCRLSASGELLIARSGGDWTVVGRLPVFRIADGGALCLSQAGYDRLVSSRECGSVEPATFVVLRDPGDSLRIIGQ